MAGKFKFAFLFAVPPILAPFSFGTISYSDTSLSSILTLGARARVLCGLTRGDTPVSFSWLKDGQSIQRHSSKVTITIVDDFSSLLTISSLQRGHAGNYTCMASNEAGRDSFTAILDVQVPPSWLEKPSNREVTLGHKVELPCRADGAPLPKITWKKEIAEGGNFMEVFKSNQDGLEISPLGSLFISEARKIHDGQYLCHVSNGVGQPLHTMVNLTIKVPPKISRDKKHINAAIKDPQLELVCTAQGDRPITVKWTKDGRDFMYATDQGRFSMETLSTSDGIQTVLVISQVIKEDAGIYSCDLSNPFGTDSHTIKVVVREPPDEPRNLKVLEASSSSARLSWEPPTKLTKETDQLLPISSFTIQWTPFQGDWDSSFSQETSGRVYAVTLDNLRPYTQYKARIKATNDLGTGHPSNVIAFWTLGDKPSGQPLNIKASVQQGQSLLLQWSDPDRSQWNGAIQGYRAGWRRMRWKDTQSSTLGVYNWTEIERYDRTDLQLLLKDLEPDARYEILLQAYNPFGRGPVAKIEAQTAEKVPKTPPEGVECQGVTSASIRLQWDLLSPPLLRGKLTSYKIHYQEVSTLDLHDSSNGGVEQVAPSALKVINSKATFVLKGLQANGNYSILLNAQTSVGDGPVSLPIFCPTKPSVPESPEEMKITVRSDSSVIISWLPPFRNFVPITGYTLHIRHKLDQDISTDQVQIDKGLHYIVEDLKPSVYYQFWVVANSLLGQGNASIILGYRVSSQHKKAVGIYSIGHLVQVTEGSTINLPCLYTGNKDAAEIDWFKDKGQNVRNSEARAQGRATIRKDRLKLTDIGTEDAGNYSCRVKAWQSEDYDAITYQIIVLTLPERPRLRLISTDSDSAKLAIDSENVEMPHLWCSIYHRAKFGQPEETLLPARNLNSIHITQLKCGTAYSVYATCSNALGISGPSNTLEEVKTIGQVPIAPSSPFVHPSNTSVRLDLFTWSSLSCPVDYFIVSYRQKNDLHWTLVSNDLGLRTRRFTIRQLEPQTSYELKIKANNPAGSTDFADIFRTVSSVEAAESAGTQLGIGSNFNKAQPPDFDQLTFILPLILALFLVLIAIAGLAVCLKRKVESLSGKYLQSQDPSQYLNCSQEKMEDRIYAQVGTSSTLQPNQIFYNAQFDSMGKVPQNPDDIYPYATFVLPDADCGAGNKVQLAGNYQEVPDAATKRQLVGNLIENMPQVSTLVFQEQSTLPLSDACSKSSTAQYQSVHNAAQPIGGQRKRARKKRSSKQPTMGLASLRQQSTLRRSEECLNTSTPESSSSESAHEDLQPQIWTRQQTRNVPNADSDTLPSSEDEEEEEAPIQNQRIFVKNANGGFVGLTPTQLKQMQIRQSPGQNRRRLN